MKIGEFSWRTHVSTRMLRYYEDKKPITPMRSASLDIETTAARPD